MELSDNTRKLLKCLRGPIRERRTHARPHPDELFAFWLLETFGLERFPGNAEAPIIPMTENGTPDGRSATSWFTDHGVIFVGCAESLFDDHNLMDDRGKRTCCSADLIAIALGVDDLKQLQPLLQYVQSNDCTGKRYGCFDLTALVDDLNAVHPTDPKAVYDVCRPIFDAFYTGGWIESTFKAHLKEMRPLVDLLTARWLEDRFRDHIHGDAVEREESPAVSRTELVVKAIGPDRFPELRRIVKYVRGFVLGGNRQGPYDLAAIAAALTLEKPKEPQRVYELYVQLLDAKLAAERQFKNALEEFRSNARIICIRNKGFRCDLGVITSDTMKVSEAGYFLGCQVMIVKRSSGHVYIGTRQGVNLPLDLVVRFLRALEQQLDSSIEAEYRELDFNEQGKPGMLESSQRWFYHKEAERLLNGSGAYPKVAPTNLLLETIVKFVAIGLQPYTVDEQRRIWSRFLREEQLVALPERLLRRLEPRPRRSPSRFDRPANRSNQRTQKPKTYPIKSNA